MKNSQSIFIKLRTDVKAVDFTRAYECVNEDNQTMIISKNDIVIAEDGSKFVHKHHFNDKSLEDSVLISNSLSLVDRAFYFVSF
ncbi:MAG: hypothetical protein GW906_06770 [Epsilonproteobacteria bacterium]|nr:hypothetical protein [Campylobacterota bacterium]OIO17536.1 MAG: hypothetical protein AUJ81_01675 [Helicobacteraceae bacterium CG1_02_36_14]PIP10656.1 MAG: hypothetical protein COX50_04920 [Sulfurimonas sp. CG23_combo_of_CG06-09_8_20_14_all_36_33]PIS25629.1 MAG: hypothetical protein COT46_05600 [Sulfurimonas sp. CG08_land_8_20_14_0_20_36_33]PIU34936.1 MAG: hypothetical protein COT05_05800 [Sulfurimonas sp. CG07_land_8_20_14_0_80_36_56]PIV04649.1 MAG: hypothetical protein COS56_04420 [Sulfur